MSLHLGKHFLNTLNVAQTRMHSTPHSPNHQSPSKEFFQPGQHTDFSEQTTSENFWQEIREAFKVIEAVVSEDLSETKTFSKSDSLDVHKKNKCATPFKPPENQSRNVEKSDEKMLCDVSLRETLTIKSTLTFAKIPLLTLEKFNEETTNKEKQKNYQSFSPNVANIKSLPLNPTPHQTPTSDHQKMLSGIMLYGGCFEWQVHKSSLKSPHRHPCFHCCYGNHDTRNKPFVPDSCCVKNTWNVASSYPHCNQNFLPSCRYAKNKKFPNYPSCAYHQASKYHDVYNNYYTERPYSSNHHGNQTTYYDVINLPSSPESEVDNKPMLSSCSFNKPQQNKKLQVNQSVKSTKNVNIYKFDGNKNNVENTFNNQCCLPKKKHATILKQPTYNNLNNLRNHYDVGSCCIC